MDKAEGRKILKQLQAITNFKGDEQAQDVIDELRRVLPTMPVRAPEPAPEPEADAERKSRRGRDRQERGGYDRSE